jgi:hypothetical protein
MDWSQIEELAINDCRNSEEIAERLPSRSWDGPLYFPPWIESRQAEMICQDSNIDKYGGPCKMEALVQRFHCTPQRCRIDAWIGSCVCQKRPTTDLALYLRHVKTALGQLNHVVALGTLLPLAALCSIHEELDVRVTRAQPSGALVLALYASCTFAE